MSTSPQVQGSLPQGAVPPPGCPAHTASGLAPLYGPGFAADPGATYARLRAQGPIARVELSPGVSASLVIGYDTALEVLRSPERFSKDPRRWRGLADGTIPADNPVVPMLSYRPNALFSDGAEHARLRGAITDCMSRVDPNALRGYVEHSADALIDEFGPDGEADLRGQYGAVLPLLVFCQVCGCPPDIAEKLVTGMSGIFAADENSERADRLLNEGIAELVAYKRDKPGADMASWLRTHPAGLTDAELRHQLTLLMGAGTEPQQNLICNALRLLLSDDRFAGDLAGGSLPVEDALDEVLWSDAPMANFAAHFPVHDVELDGTLLREGEPVLISFAAANTDPGPAAERRRGGNRAHLAWSAGPHACPAKNSARLIAAVAVEKLLDRLPDVELAVGVEQLEWRQGPFHRALAALPVRFPPVAVPASAAEPSGASPWNPRTSPSSSTPPAATSTARRPGSASGDRRRWSSFLARWWRGR
jgi:cytochrome P450